MDVCPTCGGIWFDKGQIGRLMGDRGLERAIVKYAAGAAEIACPRCRGPMARRPVGQATVEVCTLCRGIWMDRSGLEAAANLLGQSPPVGATPEIQARDLAIHAFSLRGTREAILRSATRRGYRPP